MKNTPYLTLLITFFCFFDLDAQLSIKAGVVKSNVVLKDINIDYQSKFDPLFAGIYYRLAPLNLLGFETGLQYTGIIEKASGTALDIKNHYLSIPVSMNFKPNSFFSPGFGVIVSSLFDSNNPDITAQKKVDVSAFLKVNLNPFKKLGLELGYNLGFIPFIETENVNQGGVIINNGTIQNRYLYAAAVLKI